MSNAAPARPSLKELLAAPAAARTRAIRRRMARWWGRLAGPLARALLHRDGSPFYLADRPQFDYIHGRLQPPFGELAPSWSRPADGNWGDLARMYAIAINLDAALLRTEGAIAELGVYRGGSAELMHRIAPDRRLYLFDTFEGFDDRDRGGDPSGPAARTFADTSMEHVRRRLGNSPKVIFCPGYFPETTSAVPADERFGFVHLDCDLYKPIRAGLEFFYPRLAPGGVLLVHDYLSGYWPGVPQAVDEFLLDKAERVALLPDRSGSAIIVRSQR